ncbi:MAG: RDD family protein [Clostridia bacterium]|nr:RDD family protein [Clostridia bacterium]
MKKGFREEVEYVPFGHPSQDAGRDQCGVRPEHFTNISTHENVSLYYENAGIASRYSAFVIDLLVRIGVWLIVAFVLYYAWLRDIIKSGEDIFASAEFLSSLAMVIMIIYISIYFLRVIYYVIFELFMRGRTPGKKAMGLAVVSVSGEAPRTSQIVVRNVLRFFHLIPGGELIDGIVAVCSKKAQRLGDMAAGTMVIKIRKLTGFELPVLADVPEKENAVTDYMSGAEALENAQKEADDFLKEMKERMRREAEKAALVNSGEVGEAAAAAASGTLDEGQVSDAVNDEVKSMYDIVPPGGFLTLGETIWLKEYMFKRNQYVAKDEYDQKVAVMLLKKSGSAVPKEMYKAKNIRYIQDTYNYHAILWNQAGGGGANGVNN